MCVYIGITHELSLSHWLKGESVIMHAHCKRYRVILTLASLSQLQLTLFFGTETTVGGLKQLKIVYSTYYLW